MYDMKTKTRILKTSRALFNEAGEAEQTAVDIANELEISPGNLYYHFKGKDAIIEALFDEFEEEMRLILTGSQGNIASLEDVWVYIYILLEEIYDFRFFYYNLGALLDRYPGLARRFRAIIEDKKAAITGLIDTLETGGALDIPENLKEALILQIVSTATFWLSLYQIEDRPLEPASLIHRTVYHILTLLVPYTDEAGFANFEKFTDYYHEALAETGARAHPS